MSTLTKILIVLLTISSIFLCGVVVTYVATANNYKEQSKKLKSQRDAAVDKQETAETQLREVITESQRLEDNLKKQIASLKTELTQLKQNIKNTDLHTINV